MSNPPEPPPAPVADPPPAPPAPPAPAPPTPPVPPTPVPSTGGSESVLETLQNTVASLVEKVTTLTATPDTRPVATPWTHWGAKKK